MMISETLDMIEFYRISSVPALTFRHDYMLVSFLPSFFFFLKKKEGHSELGSESHVQEILKQVQDDRKVGRMTGKLECITEIMNGLLRRCVPRNDDSRYTKVNHRHCEEGECPTWQSSGFLYGRHEQSELVRGARAKRVAAAAKRATAPSVKKIQDRKNIKNYVHKNKEKKNEKNF